MDLKGLAAREAFMGDGTSEYYTEVRNQELMDRGHTCIKNDGGTPNRKCYACEAEDKAAMAINPNPPGVIQRLFTPEEAARLSDDYKQRLEDRSGRKARHSSRFSEWGTPKAMYTKLDKEFRFCLDAAANKANAKHMTFFGPDHDNPSFRDALKIGSWYESVMDSFAWARPVFCNPPFSREEKIPIEPWIEKFWIESQRGLPLVTPIPASIQTRWWEEFVRKAHEVRIIPHRVAFEPPVGYEGAATGAGNNTAVVVWKPWDGYREPFEAVYRYWSYRD